MVKDVAGTRGAGFQGRLASKIVVVVGSQGVGATLGYAALLAIGRFYSPGAYGAYLFAVSLIGLASTLFQLGFTQAHQRQLAQGLPLRDALGVYARIRSLLLLGMAIAVAAGLWVWLGLLDQTFTDSTSLSLIIVLLASGIIVGLRKIATDTWLAQGRVHRSEWCNTVDSVTYAAVVVLVGLGLGSAQGRWSPMPWLGEAVADTLGLVGTADVFTLGLYIAVGHFAGKIAGISLATFWWLRDRTEIGPWNPGLAREYRAFALPVALTSVLALVLQHTDVLMLGFFWTTKEVGWYGAAQKIANIALLANVALRGLLMPYFASLIKQGDHDRAVQVFRQIERFLLFAVIPGAIAMMIWAEAGIHIAIGDGFLGGAPALRWLAAWTLVAAMNMPVRARQMAAGETDILVRASIINVFVNVILNILLIPTSILGVPLAGLGAEGAAMATFSASLTAYLYGRFFVSRGLGVRFVDAAQVRMFLAALVPLAVWGWLAMRLPATAYDRVWELGAIGVLGTAVYVLALWLVKGLGADDLALVRRALNPGNISKEVRGRE